MFRAPTLKFAVLLLFLLLPFTQVLPGEDLKQIHPAGYVTDLAGVIAPETKARIETLATELQQKTGAQMAVVTVHSFNGASLENYAVDLYKQLGVGYKQDNRGVLLLVSPDQRQYRIEVGYGLEPVINDARAGDAGRTMVPFLRQGDYSTAIEAAAWQLAKYVADDRGVTLSGQPPTRPVRRSDDRQRGGIPFSLIIGIFVVIWLLSRGSGRGGGGGWWLWPLLTGGWGRGGWGGGGFGGGGGGYSGGGGGGWGGFGGGSSGGGGASGSW